MSRSRPAGRAGIKVDGCGVGSRVGVIDIGSNSVRMVVYEGLGRSPERFFNEKEICALGADIDRTGRLDPAGCVKALVTLRRFRTLADTLAVDRLEGVATSAVRDASDGPDFVREVKRNTGIRLRILEGEEEARLVARGVLLGTPDAEGLVADLGGGSLELARLAMGKVQECASLPVGSLRFASTGRSPRWVSAEIKTHLDRSTPLLRRQPRIYLVGGGWRALARIHMRRTGYPVRVLQGYALGRRELREAIRWVRAQTPDGLRPFSSAAESRLKTVPYAALVLDRLAARVRPEEVVFSVFGLREGIYHRHLSASCRSEDPLIAACENLETRRARSPGYGGELYRWLRPLFAEAGAAEQRLIRAACLVNDIEWRENPDYRAAAAFETMMRVTVSGVSHPERLFVFGSLLFRHKGGRRAAAEIPGLALLPPERLARARTLGTAMRAAATLSGAMRGVLPECRLQIDNIDIIVVTLPGSLAALAGGRVQNQLELLGQAMSRRVRLEVAAE